MSEINVLADAKVTESAKTVVTMIISTNVLITVLAILTVRMAVLVTIIMGNSIARIILQGQHKYFKILNYLIITLTDSREDLKLEHARRGTKCAWRQNPNEIYSRVPPP